MVRELDTTSTPTYRNTKMGLEMGKMDEWSLTRIAPPRCDNYCMFDFGLLAGHISPTSCLVELVRSIKTGGTNFAVMAGHTYHTSAFGGFGHWGQSREVQ